MYKNSKVTKAGREPDALWVASEWKTHWAGALRDLLGISGANTAIRPSVGRLSNSIMENGLIAHSTFHKWQSGSLNRVIANIVYVTCVRRCLCMRVCACVCLDLGVCLCTWNLNWSENTTQTESCGRLSQSFFCFCTSRVSLKLNVDFDKPVTVRRDHFSQFDLTRHLKLYLSRQKCFNCSNNLGEYSYRGQIGYMQSDLGAAQRFHSLALRAVSMMIQGLIHLTLQ